VAVTETESARGPSLAGMFARVRAWRADHGDLVLCFVLIPRFGLIGAASATAAAILVESMLLFVTVKLRLGLHVFVLGRPKE
jgi:hypothetical protein